MAMNLATAEADLAVAIAQALGDTYGEGDPTDYVEFSESLAPAMMVILQHILDNAEDSLSGPIT